MSERDQDKDKLDPNPSINPLFGASPPDDVRVSEASHPPPSLGGPDVTPLEATAEPLYGATPPTDADAAGSVQASPREYVLQHGGPSYRPSSSIFYLPGTRTLAFIRRLTFLLSLLLGISASFAGIWSYLLLPRLHATFSARKVLAEQQLSRVNALVDSLRKVRATSIYPPVQIGGGDRDGVAEVAVGDGVQSARDEHKLEKNRPKPRREASLKEITSHPSSPSSSSSSSSHSHPSSPSPCAELPLTPLSPLHTLSEKLHALTAALDSTSTTRTSLISTLESYTSHLHREMFVARPHRGFGGYSIGGTLGSSLASAGAGAAGGWGGQGTGTGAGFKGKEDWDNVRKEIRAIKGVLLNRRSFTPPTPQGNGVAAR